MNDDQYFLEACFDLEDGGSISRDAKGYTIHRYGNTWLAMWHTSMMSLGREFSSAMQLNDFVRGNFSAGLEIDFPKVS